MDFNEESKQTSKYNDAMLSISRLNDSWNLCKQFISMGNYTKWKFELDKVWLELFPDVLKQKQEKDKVIFRNKELRKKVALSKNKNELYFNLLERHEFLRELQDMSGKGGVYIDENDEGFE